MPSSKIEDVAAAAGVSAATVSRALRGLPNVAATTRARVQAAALQLDYLPNPAAAQLAAGRSTTVAMAVPVLTSWYFAAVMAGAESILSRAGYDVLVVAIDSSDAADRILRGPLVRRADGLITCDLRLTPSQLKSIADQDVSLVSIGREHLASRTVFVDDFGVAVTATNHLLDLGHRRIGLIDGRAGPHNHAVPGTRREGYLHALRYRGIEADPALTACGDFTIDSGRLAMRQLLDSPAPPTAVFAMSDEMAFGAMQAAQECGLSVPEDVSVIGVDNHECGPVLGLTTIDQDVSSHGVVAAELLLSAMSGEASDEQLTDFWHAPTLLVRRTSTAPPHPRNR